MKAPALGLELRQELLVVECIGCGRTDREFAATNEDTQTGLCVVCVLKPIDELERVAEILGRV